jgi:hypothetical protein
MPPSTSPHPVAPAPPLRTAPRQPPRRALLTDHLTYRWERLREEQRQQVSNLVAADQQRRRDRVRHYARLLVLALAVDVLLLLLALQGVTL